MPELLIDLHEHCLLLRSRIGRYGELSQTRSMLATNIHGVAGEEIVTSYLTQACTYPFKNASPSLELRKTVLRREMEIDGGGRVAAVRARIESRNSILVR
jgi:hypothetical protein